ncbi:MAG: ribonuclease J [Candidatus Acidiferrales bacterium]
MSQQSVWAIPLGGLGEFGMNMMVLRTGDDIIVIDAGLMFPEQELLGVDIVIPDITYLKQNRSKIRAIVLTHAHEDHIGAIPYILPELNVPIYGTEFTLALVRKKLEEHALLEGAQLNEVAAGQTTQLGAFSIEYLHVTHSTIDCVALAVRTPVGVIIHTGDFKIDPTPVDGKPFDLHAFAKYGQEGVLALFSDSTNVERPGFTPSEKSVVVRLEELFRAAPARVVVSCFSSSVHRVQQVIDIARTVGRKVGVVGRSMVDNLEIAHTLGKIRIPDGSMVRPQDIRGYDPRRLVVLASGTQAEPMSALSRISVDNHRLMSIAESDTVILSSRIIPGNEKQIFRMIDHFFRRRVLVYYESGRSAPIHVSGHASQEEMKILLQLVKPKYFVPMHGEYRQLFQHAALAEQLGAVGSEIFLLESGQPVEFTADGRAFRREPVTAGRVLVDSGSLEEIEEVVIRDRRHLSEDGVLVPIIAINKHTGKIEATPEIVTRGFLPSEEGAEIIEQARQITVRTVEQATQEEKTDWGVIKEKIRQDLKRFLNKQTSKRPLILPVILEI